MDQLPVTCHLLFDQRSLIHREAWFPPCFARENQQKTFFCVEILDHLQAKHFKTETFSFHYYFLRIPNL